MSGAPDTLVDFHTGIIFAYAGQTIYPEMIAEMEHPQDFPKALCVSTPYLLSVYTIVGCTAYYYYGAAAPDYLMDILSYNWTRTFGGVMMMIHMIISYTITQQVVTRAVHRLVWRETINALDRKDPLFWKGTCHWFTISTLHLVAAYVVANSIPIFSQLNGLIGAVLSPFLSFVIPCVEINILRRVRAESSRRPPRHRRDLLDGVMMPVDFHTGTTTTQRPRQRSYRSRATSQRSSARSACAST